MSFSVGLMTFENMPGNVKEVIKIADNLMYSVKNKDKNNVFYKIWRNENDMILRSDR